MAEKMTRRTFMKSAAAAAAAISLSGVLTGCGGSASSAPSSVSGASASGREMQNKGDHTDFFHHGYLRITYFIKRYPPNTCNNMPGIPIRKSCTAAVKLPVKAHSPADPTIW